jgi:hypothetical protein
VSLATRALLAPLLCALLACSGSTNRVEPGDGGAGDDGPNGCPSQLVVGTPDTACSDDGQTCPGTVVVDICGNTSDANALCTCSGGKWSCPVAVSGACPAPDPPCPSPSQVIPGDACDVLPQNSCSSNITISSCDGQPTGSVEPCNCLGGSWACPELGAGCPVDAGPPCPDPNQVFDGGGCDTYGSTCQGDPQSCGGTTVYDTLQCYAGAWTLVAQTVCESDAGGDAEVIDGGAGD